MKTRRQAREAVLQLLYQGDTLKELSDKDIENYFECFAIDQFEETKQENLDFAKQIIKGVLDNIELIDEHIAESSENWSMLRMSRVDRNILRLATYEIYFMPDIPFSVSINEGIEIAKRYGCDDSPTFINGVLDKVAGSFQENPLTLPKKIAANT